MGIDDLIMGLGWAQSPSGSATPAFIPRIAFNARRQPCPLAVPR
jgi:hypothetical protein